MAAGRAGVVVFDGLPGRRDRTGALGRVVNGLLQVEIVASNALLVDGSRDLTGAQNLGVAGLRGTLQAAGSTAHTLDILHVTSRLDIDNGIALGAGSSATLGTIGGSGPTATAQAVWVEIDVGGTPTWLAGWR